MQLADDDYDESRFVRCSTKTDVFYGMRPCYSCIGYL